MSEHPTQKSVFIALACGGLLSKAGCMPYTYAPQSLREAISKLNERNNGRPILGELGSPRPDGPPGLDPTNRYLDRVREIRLDRVAIKLENVRIEDDKVVADVTPYGPLGELANELMNGSEPCFSIGVRGLAKSHTRHKGYKDIELSEIVTFDLVTSPPAIKEP